MREVKHARLLESFESRIDESLRASTTGRVELKLSPEEQAVFFEMKARLIRAGWAVCTESLRDQRGLEDGIALLIAYPEGT